MKTVLLTGASGMLGKALAGTLRGYDLVGTGRREMPNAPFVYQVCDLSSRPSVQKLIRPLEPEIVIHAAAYTDVDGCEKNFDLAMQMNFEATKNIVDSIAGLETHFIFVSTDYVFDGRKKEPYLETDATCPLSAYGKSKAFAEAYIRENAAWHHIVRCSWLYGPFGKNFVDTILAASAQKELLTVVSDQRGRPTYTMDLAQAFTDILEYAERTGEKESGILHVANQGEASWFDFAKEIVALSGSSCRVEPISTAQLGRPAPRPANSVLNTDLFDGKIGKPLRHWKEALREYVARRASFQAQAAN